MKRRILIRGASEHNLKGIDLEIPHQRLTVVTGVSGSGKSSLAFDVICQEGQRRFVESLSAYARQYLGKLDKPRVEHIEGLSPTISIDQKTISRNPRSTVGTVTEILDYLRLLFARLGVPHCPRCGARIQSRTVEQIVNAALEEWPGEEILITAPIILDRKGEYRRELAELRTQGFVRVRVDGVVRRLDEPIALARYERHTIEVVYDRLRLEPDRRSRIAEAVEKALELGNGLVVLVLGGESHLRSSLFACPRCNVDLPELEPRLFSFNSPHGACRDCGGLGFTAHGSGGRAAAENGAGGEHGAPSSVEGRACAACEGTRLRPEARAVLFRSLDITALSAFTVDQAAEFFGALALDSHERPVAQPIVREVGHRLQFLSRVGLGYLTLDRSAATLSGGEAQRIRLASQLGSGLRGVLYVLDEPSIGLHPRDQSALLDLLRELRDLGNTVLVVEHDRETIEAADYLVDIGPGAGIAGGHLVAAGPLARIRDNPESITGRYLAGRERIETPLERRAPERGWIEIRGARQHNLRDLTVHIPLGLLTAVTGVSGSGKSTLVDGILYRAAARRLGLESPEPGTHDTILGLEEVDRVIAIDQTPIGRTPRSNPGTYCKVFDEIRELFARTPESRVRGYARGRFSFNVRGGRCENCGGAGVITIRMQFLPDVEVTCEECNGRRYNSETLEVSWRGRSIAEILDLTVAEAAEFFADVPRIAHTLRVLVDVGLGYVRLGQPSTTLSGGEAQRVKLGYELRKTATGRTLYLLDEPTTGLHFDDIRKLLAALQSLVERGNTMVIIEHNLDVVRSADHVIDLGPGGGEAGGSIVAAGTPEEVARSAGATGSALAAALAARRGSAGRAGKKRGSGRGEPSDRFRITGAREHNLKNVTVEIPRECLTVITGRSGSGKSTLAFDILFAEGQRRYVESLSTYARRFLGRMQRAEVDRVEGIAPAIAIDQKGRGASPRSTVATTTEIYDYLRILFARAGVPHCPVCAVVMEATTPSAAARRLEEALAGERVHLLAPLHRPGGERNARSGAEHLARVAPDLIREGFTRVLVDGAEMRLERLAENGRVAAGVAELHLIVDRVIPGRVARNRLAESIEEAYRRGQGRMEARLESGARGIAFTRLPACPAGHHALEQELSPRLFSFNHHSGACPSCHGLGVRRELDPDSFFDHPERPLFRGAMDHRPGKWIRRPRGRVRKAITAAFAAAGLDLARPVSAWSDAARLLLLDGSGERVYAVRYRAGPPGHRYWASESAWEGLDAVLRRWHERASSPAWRQALEERMSLRPCSLCRGGRLRPELLAVRFQGKGIHEVCASTIREAQGFFGGLALAAREREIAGELVREIEHRLGFLMDVGLDYLTLDRVTETLSGGEAQRIRLATQIGNRLVGVLYVMDEPTIGLHQRDNERLLGSLLKLRDQGNSLVIVEHDEQTIRLADHVIDLGPGAGADGGRIVARGTPQAIARRKESVTGRYLSGALSIPLPEKRRTGDGGTLVVLGAAANNLKQIDVAIPTGTFTAITGVSGSGKSSLVMDILARAGERHFHGARTPPGRHRAIDGWERFTGIGVIDQSPLGRTPSSNPATYTGVWDPIRALWASLPQSKARGWDKGRFSFNRPGGRCEQCEGKGSLLVEMHFLSDVWVPCEGCGGARYERETLEVRYRGRTIADVLQMEIAAARDFFADHPSICPMLSVLVDVGLGYVALGQAAHTLSGGEAQRVKLAAELGKTRRGAHLYLLDEPTTGLHFADVKLLLEVLVRLVARGHTVVVIEHNLDVIRAVDHVIDLGPEGGAGGGRIVAMGTPEAIAAHASSHTGRYLKPVLARGDKRPRGRRALTP